MKEKIINLLNETKIISIIRAESSEELLNVAKALKEGGIKFIEVTMTTPGALKAIEEFCGEMEDVIIGVGSVLDSETARLSILSGAEFIVTPTLNFDVIKMCKRYSKVVIPGAFTPTEIINAWESGADFVKVFPASVGGPSYIKAIKAPLPQVNLIPVGGVNIDNVSDFIKAGSSAVAVGSQLVKKGFLKEKNFEAIKNLAKEFVEKIKGGGK